MRAKEEIRADIEAEQNAQDAALKLIAYAYLRNYDSKGPQLLGTIRTWPIQRFRAWLRSGATSEPAKKSLR